MKYCSLALMLLVVIISIGCVEVNNSISNPASLSSDPSIPASYEEKYCLDVTQNDVVLNRNPDAYGGVIQYNPLVSITGTVKSNCDYPVVGIVQLRAYDKNNKMIQGLFSDGVQQSSEVRLKPGESTTYSMTFDMRRVPDNPRDPDPSITANFEVKGYVTRIVSGREAASW